MHLDKGRIIKPAAAREDGGHEAFAPQLGQLIIHDATHMGIEGALRLGAAAQRHWIGESKEHIPQRWNAHGQIDKRAKVKFKGQRRNQAQRCHAIGLAGGEMRGNAAAHGIADQMHRLLVQFQRLEQTAQRPREMEHRLLAAGIIRKSAAKMIIT